MFSFFRNRQNQTDSITPRVFRAVCAIRENKLADMMTEKNGFHMINPEGEFNYSPNDIFKAMNYLHLSDKSINIPVIFSETLFKLSQGDEKDIRKAVLYFRAYLCDSKPDFELDKDFIYRMAGILKNQILKYKDTYINTKENVFTMWEELEQENDRLINYDENLRIIDLPDNYEIYKNILYTKRAADSVYEIKNNVLAAFNSTTARSAVIPEGVTAIGENVFSNNRNLQVVYFPDSVKEIGKSAFENCKNLVCVYNGLGVEKIGEKAFYNCRNFADIILSDKLTKISDWTFAHTKIQTINIPDSVHIIGDNAFFGCEKLYRINGMKNVVSINKGAFICCNKLKYFQLYNGLKSIGEQAFSESYLDIDEFHIPDTVTEIGERAFDTNFFRKVNIPKSMKSFDSKILHFSFKLKEVIVSGDTELTGDKEFWENIRIIQLSEEREESLLMSDKNK